MGKGGGVMLYLFDLDDTLITSYMRAAYDAAPPAVRAQARAAMVTALVAALEERES